MLIRYLSHSGAHYSLRSTFLSFLLFKLFVLYWGLYSQLTMLWKFQVDDKGTQSHVYIYPFSPKFPFHPGCHLTLSRVPCAVLYSRSLLVICLKYSRVCMSIPNSRTIPHLPSPPPPRSTIRRSMFPEAKLDRRPVWVWGRHRLWLNGVLWGHAWQASGRAGVSLGGWAPVQRVLVSGTQPGCHPLLSSLARPFVQ